MSEDLTASGANTTISDASPANLNPPRLVPRSGSFPSIEPIEWRPINDETTWNDNVYWQGVTAQRAYSQRNRDYDEWLEQEIERMMATFEIWGRDSFNPGSRISPDTILFQASVQNPFLNRLPRTFNSTCFGRSTEPDTAEQILRGQLRDYVRGQIEREYRHVATSRLPMMPVVNEWGTSSPTINREVGQYAGVTYTTATINTDPSNTTNITNIPRYTGHLGSFAPKSWYAVPSEVEYDMRFDDIAKEYHMIWEESTPLKGPWEFKEIKKPPEPKEPEQLRLFD